MIDQFKVYYSRAKMMQELKFQGGSWTKEDVNDDLVWHVPIYDVVNRKYAAFSSFLEAVKLLDKDPKNNGKFFAKSKGIKDFDFVLLCYLFRLSGSGINYIPNVGGSPFMTHGFGNFWCVDHVANGVLTSKEWLKDMPEKGFCDVKGYLLPMIKGGLRNFIQLKSQSLVFSIVDHVTKNKGLGIKDVVDYGNSWLMQRGFKRQNFVLTAFAMDLAEYFPEHVDPNSDVYVGSNAKKCLKLIMPGVKHDKALRELCEITGGYSKPMDMEDVACDFIRYKDNFQSKHHVEANGGITYKNNL